MAGFVFWVRVVRRVRGQGDLSRLVPRAVSRCEHAYRCFEVYDTASMCENWRGTRGGGPARPPPPTLFFRLAFAARASVSGHSVAWPCLPGFVTDSIVLLRAAVCGETTWGGAGWCSRAATFWSWFAVLGLPALARVCAPLVRFFGRVYTWFHTGESGTGTRCTPVMVRRRTCQLEVRLGHRRRRRPLRATARTGSCAAWPIASCTL